ncbi:type II secretion system protein GspM [Ectopseudomonas mendocina]|uniref:Type II secretion system protein GspM n=1 Tax=Ectopseudomonas mendocina TaxID=300 RepID=A0ABZ2RD21_ECTME
MAMFKTVLHRVQPHWQRLAKREQQALLGLALFFALVGFYRLIWQPQEQALERARDRFSEVSLLQQQLQQLPLDASSNDESALSPSTLPGHIARSSNLAGLNLERMDNETPERISLSLEGPLNNLIQWIDQLEQKQVHVTALSLEVASNAIATAQLQVEIQ